MGDERKIRQVLLNLLSNAVKFTPRGAVAARAAPADGAVEISVSDTGIGIAPEDQEAIFQEFRQVGTDYAGSARARGSASPSPGGSSISTAGGSGSRAGSARARPSPSPFRRPWPAS